MNTLLKLTLYHPCSEWMGCKTIFGFLLKGLLKDDRCGVSTYLPVDPDGFTLTVSPRSASVLLFLGGKEVVFFFDCKWKQTSEVSQFIYKYVYIFFQDFIFRIANRIYQKKNKRQDDCLQDS